MRVPPLSFPLRSFGWRGRRRRTEPPQRPIPDVPSHEIPVARLKAGPTSSPQFLRYIPVVFLRLNDRFARREPHWRTNKGRADSDASSLSCGWGRQTFAAKPGQMSATLPAVVSDVDFCDIRERESHCAASKRPGSSTMPVHGVWCRAYKWQERALLFCGGWDACSGCAECLGRLGDGERRS